MFGKKKKGADPADGDDAGDAGETEMQDKGDTDKGGDGEAPVVGEMKRGDYMIHVYV